MSSENITLVLDKKVNLLDGWRVELVQKPEIDSTPDTPPAPTIYDAACKLIVQNFSFHGKSTQSILHEFDRSITLNSRYSYIKRCVDKNHEIDENDKIEYTWFYSLDNSNWDLVPVRDAFYPRKSLNTVRVMGKWIKSLFSGSLDGSVVYLKCIAFVRSEVARNLKDFKRDSATRSVIELPKPSSWPSYAENSVGQLGDGKAEISGAFITDFSVTIKAIPHITHSVKCKTQTNPYEEFDYKATIQDSYKPVIFYAGKRFNIKHGNPDVSFLPNTVTTNCKITYSNTYPAVVNTNHSLHLASNSFDFDTDFIANGTTWSSQGQPRPGTYTVFNRRINKTQPYQYPSNDYKSARTGWPLTDPRLKSGLSKGTIVPPGYAFGWPAVELLHSVDGNTFQTVFSEGVSEGYTSQGALAAIWLDAGGNKKISHLGLTRSASERINAQDFPNGYYKIRIKPVVSCMFPRSKQGILSNTQDGAILGYLPWISSDTIQIVDGSSV